MKQFLTLVLLVGSFHFATAQTKLEGTVRDADSGEPIVFGTVALFQNGVLVTGGETDFDGYYTISAIDAGVYEVEFSNAGYKPRKVKAFFVQNGKSNKLDAKVFAEKTMGCGLICGYRPPMIYQDNTTQGHTFRMEEIRHSPLR